VIRFDEETGNASAFAHCENIRLTQRFAVCEYKADASDIPPAIEAVLEKIP